ncbi:Ig-like domain repeat protein [Halogeometricum borinquense]|uniref:Ig-like domain repeat protein n=1 Tax=Halogeometricum borinquense TaxID=60847 RepID=A0A482TQ37_9EURY|nr:Ig-like domain repeat protein [Halogeometricum borinquense]RYJ15025.1 Ig-like domain repeat protein [Halogeometricum borinquense]
MIRDRLEDARRPTIVAFALFATYLVVSTAPVAAASTNSAVASKHTTDSDFSSATTLENMEVSGSGDSAVVQLSDSVHFSDGFEDYSVGTVEPGNWYQDSTSYGDDQVSDARAKFGSKSYYLEKLDGNGGGRLQHDVSETTANVSWYVYAADSNSESTFYLQDNGDSVVTIGIRDGELKYYNGSSFQTISTVPDSGEWVHLKISNIDAADDEATISWETSDGETGSATFQFRNDMDSGGYDAIGIAEYNSESWFDGILGDQPDTGTHVSDVHAAGNVTEAWVDFAALSGADATVTWQAKTSGTWSDVATQTYSSTGNYTLDVSGTSADEWRVRVDVDVTGESPAVEIADEGLLFNPEAPSADGGSASPQGGEETNNEDVTLSVPISDSDFSTPQGDSVTVDVYLDGEIVDTQTITSNQTVSTTVTELEDGNHTWHVETTDEYGEATTSSTWNFTVNHYAADVDNSSASPDGSTSRYANETISIDVSDRDFAEPSGDEVKVDLVLDGAVAGSKNVTKNGTVTFDVGPLEDGNHTWHVETTDEYGLTSESDSFTWEIDHYEPTVNSSSMSPEDGAKLTSKDVTLSVNVSDRDFQLDGDTVTAEFVVDSEVVGTDTLSANGTASTTITDVGGGNHSWYVRVYDEYGSGNSSNPDATSANKTYLVPSTLYIRPVNQPKELINGTNVTVTGRFFSGELVFERSTENGKLNLTDLPVDRTYVLVLEADGHNRRTVIITSLYEQDSVYLLNDSKTAYYTEFVLNDLTGEFSGSNERAKLYIERAVNTSSGLEWVTVSGDFFGAEGRFEATLEKDRRYRIRIVGEHNSSRVLGAYTATRKGTVTLNVGQVSWKVEDNTQAIRHSAAYIDLTDGNEEPNGVVHFQYHDPTQNTSKLRVIIHAANNSSNEIMNSTYTEGYGTFSLNKTVSGNLTETDWEVTWYAYNSSNTVIESSNDLADGKRYVIENPIGPKWTPVILTCLFLFVGMLFGGRLSSIGSLAVTGVAAVMWWLGWYTASGGVVVFAGLVAVAMAVGGGGRR